MKTLKKKRRIQVIIVTLVALFLATGLIAYAMRDGINFFKSPSQLLDNPPDSDEIFRLGGLVEEGSLIRGEGETITFSVTDGGKSIPVTFTGVPPDLFGENQGMIGKGRYIDGIFVADEILAKHDEDYIPKELADALKEQGVYQQSDAAIAKD